MKLSFSGFENVLEIVPGQISVLQIESIQLFTRVCQSIFGLGESEVLESFSLWSDDGKELSKKNSFLSIVDPFNLPWRDRGLISALYDQVEQYMKEDDEIIRLRTNIRQAAEAKVANGTLTVTEMLREVTAESLARQTQALHKIELLMNM